jgi:hypothetical protein
VKEEGGEFFLFSFSKMRAKKRVEKSEGLKERKRGRQRLGRGRGREKESQR